MLKLELIENESSVHELRREWSLLGAAATPMQSPEWMLSWWRAHRGPQDRLCMLVLRNSENELIGLAPWYRRATVTSGTTLRFLGSGRACSDYQTVLCRAEARRHVVQRIVEWLSHGTIASELPGNAGRLRWDLLDLEGVSIDDPFMHSFIEAMADRGHVTHRRSSESTWRMDLSGGWQGFLSRQSKTQRSQTRNFVNRFDKSTDLGMRLASEEHPDRAAAIISTLIELHQLRWRAVGGDGCFANVRMKTFFENAMREMIASNSADIVVLERNNRPIAAQAWLIQGTSIYAYQSGRDPAEDANRVGRIANSVALRWACDRGYQAIDYLRGDESYKSQMRAVPTLGQRVRIVARASFPELRHKLWLACRGVKSRLQELRGPAAEIPPTEQAAAAHTGVAHTGVAHTQGPRTQGPPRAIR